MVSYIFDFRLAKKLRVLHMESSRSMSDTALQSILADNPLSHIEVLGLHTKWLKIRFVPLVTGVFSHRLRQQIVVKNCSSFDFTVFKTEMDRRFAGLEH